MALPNNNLWVHQVANELGESSNDIAVLCLSAKVNMFSKKKPVRYENANPDLWYKGDDGFHSLYLPTFDGTDTQEWSYLKPTGVGTSAYCLHHFRGYHHTAGYPIALPFKPLNPIPRTYFFNAITAVSDDYQIAIGDLGLRLGVEIRHTGGAVIGWASAPLGSSVVKVDLNGILNVTAIDARFFLTDVTKAWADGSVGHTRYALPRHWKFNPNTHWINVPVISDSEPTGYTMDYLYASQSGTGVRITYKTTGYYGACEVIIRRRSDNFLVSKTTFTIPYGLTDLSHDISLATDALDPGTVYYVRTTFPSAPNPNLVTGEAEFVTLMETL